MLFITELNIIRLVIRSGAQLPGGVSQALQTGVELLDTALGAVRGYMLKRINML